jgi:hypothetical protein
MRRRHHLSRQVSGPNGIAERRLLIEVLLADSARQLDAAQTVSATMGTRAALLIASASIAASINAPARLTFSWYALALSSSVLAALLGIVVFLPRRSKELDLQGIEAEAWNLLDAEVLRSVLYSRIAVLVRDRKAIRRRARLLAVGFSALALSLVFVGLQLSKLPFP